MLEKISEMFGCAGNFEKGRVCFLSLQEIWMFPFQYANVTLRVPSPNYLNQIIEFKLFV